MGKQKKEWKLKDGKLIETNETYWIIKIAFDKIDPSIQERRESKEGKGVKEIKIRKESRLRGTMEKGRHGGRIFQVDL